MRRVREGTPVKRNFVSLNSPERVESYFQQITELTLSIRDHGMKRRGATRPRFGSYRMPFARLPWLELLESEIGVAIGPAGEIYRFGAGKHRTAAAQALGLESMPVEVRMVHVRWLERQVRRTGLPPTEALLQGIRDLSIGG